MLTNREKISRLQAEYQEATEREKATLVGKKTALFKTAARQNKLIDKQTERALVRLIRQGLFKRMDLTGMPVVDEIVTRGNKETDRRLNAVLEHVINNDCLGALKALQPEISAAIARMEKDEKGREEIEKKIAERDGKNGRR